MTDAKKNPATKAVTKPKTATKAKAKPKTKPKAETKNKANTADTAPDTKNASKTEPYHAEPAKRKSSTPTVVLLVSAVLIFLTIYKLNDERSNLPAQADPQENAVTAETTSAAMHQINPVNNNTDMQSAPGPYQDTPPAYEKTLEQARVDAQERVTKHDKMMQQRRQAYEKEMQSKQQQHKATMEAHQQERAKIAKARKDEFERLKQNHLETRMKVQEMQQQIFDLHEKIRQLMHERYTRH